MGLTTSFILKIFGPESTLTMNVKNSENSLIHRILSKNNVLTFFTDEKVGVPQDIATYCIENAFFGHSWDWNHREWHQNKREQNENHTHLGKAFGIPIKPKELECLLNGISKIQKQYESCLNNKTDCLLTDEDIKKILAEYEKFYPKQVAFNTKQTEVAIQEFKNFLQNLTIACVRSFVHSFITTLLHHYVRPYIQSKQINLYLDLQTIEELTHVLISVALAPTFLQAGVEFILRQLMLTMLDAKNLNENQKNEISAIFSPILSGIATCSNPLSLIDITVGEMNAHLGKKLAYTIIHQLPKIKHEPVARAPEREGVVSGMPSSLHRVNRQRANA